MPQHDCGMAVQKDHSFFTGSALLYNMYNISQINPIHDLNRVSLTNNNNNNTWNITHNNNNTWNMTHNTESTAVLNPERWGSLLIQENYQEE